MPATLHRIFSYIRHRLTAWNTTGEGIHSPWLFYLVRFVIRDRNSYYCWADIERRRELLLACGDSLEVVDYGSAGSPEGKPIRRRVCDIARRHLESPAMGQMLFRLVKALGEEEKRPLLIMELGSSLGISTAYLAAPDRRNRVITFEGSDAVLKIAKATWKTLELENIEWEEGNIDHTLASYCARRASTDVRETIDIAFIDANHTYEATCRYTDFFLPRMSEKGIIILDDIHHSQEMERAWHRIQADPRVTTTIDVWHMGLVFVDRHYLKKHYRVIGD